jgi:glycosyltransferase involved in cell wall biosynthesis
MQKTFSIVVPVYNNEENIPDTVAQLLALGKELPGYRLELVFVDDGSSDRSLALLQAERERRPETITLVKLTRNFGQTPAVQAGLQHAAGEVVGVISADLQEPHETFPEMVRAWEKGARFVIGERVDREEGALHALVSSIYWRLIRRFAFPDFPPLGFDFFVMDRQLVDDLNRIEEKNSSIYCLVYWLGYRATRIPVVRKKRARGRSQWGLARKIRITIDTAISFTTLPTRMITYSAFALGAAALAYLVFATWQWAVLHSAPPGWMTVIGFLTLIGAMLLFALGIISEYLLRILQEQKRRPAYVVERAERRTG